YQRKEETYQKIISNLQKELENRHSTIIELIEYVLNKINESVSTDLEVYQQEEEVQQEKVIYQQQEEEVQQEKVICQQREEEVVYQQEETDDELDYNPDTK
ncbi:27017_t:CDS:2, partial [Racocetra persica]